MKFVDSVESWDEHRLCECGRAEKLPQEDLCHLCLGKPPVSVLVSEANDYIGSPEWKEEMRHFWPTLFPKKEKNANT